MIVCNLMKTFRYIFLLLLNLNLVMPFYGQDNTIILQRTPDQEATKQTDKLQQELNLNPEQTKQVYEINLKYARERQVSNTRSEAMERMKNKNAAIESVLNNDQNNRLQTKRYERSTIESQIGNRSIPGNSSSYRSSPDFRSNSSVTTTRDNNMQNTYRSSSPQVRTTTEQNPTLRRNTTTPSYTPEVLRNQQTTRLPSSTYSSPKQSVTSSSPRESTSSRSQSTPSSTPKKSETTTGSRR